MPEQEVAEPDLYEAPPEFVPEHPAVLKEPNFQQPGEAGKGFAKLMKEFHEQTLSGKQLPAAASPTEPESKPDSQPSAAAPRPKPAIEVPPEIKGKAAEGFRMVHERADQAEKKAAEFEKKSTELEARLKALEGAAKPNEEAIAEARKKLEETTKRAEDYEKIVQQFYVEHSPEFQAEYRGGIESAINDAKAAAGDKADAIAEVLAGPSGKGRDRAIKELTAELDEFDKMRIVQAYERVIQTERKRDNTLARSREAFQLLQKQNQEKSATQQAAAKQQAEMIRAKVLEATEVIDKLGDFDDDKEAAAFRKEWVTKASREDYPIADQLKVPAQAAEYARLRERVIPGLLAKLKERDEQIAALQGSSPGVHQRTNQDQQPQIRRGGPITSWQGNQTQNMPAKEAFLRTLSGQ